VIKPSRRDDDIDGLFSLPLSEFTAARNALAARLKKSGKSDEADRVKALAKPSVSAWTANQLYWKHRDAFERLLATGQGFRDAQRSQLAGKAGSMREQADARREALSELMHLADALLSDSGHNPTSDTLRRVSTTLEALSAYASLPNAPTPGRLSEDLAPPGFEALAGLMPSAAASKASTKPSVHPAPDNKTDQAALAEAKHSMKAAESALKEAQGRARKIDAELTHASAKAKDAAKDKRDAEQFLMKATVAAEKAEQHRSRTAAGAEAAARDVENAERVLDEASKELDRIRSRSSRS
jgi:hypothetical protein